MISKFLLWDFLCERCISLSVKLDDNSVVVAERINDNKKVKSLDKRPKSLKFITPEQQVKSVAIHNLGPQLRKHKYF